MLKASFTIEAAVIVPLTMILLITALFGAFFAHNAATIAAVTDAAILEQGADGKANESGISGKIKERLAHRLIGETDLSVSVSGGQNQRSAHASAGFGIPLAMIDDLTEGKMRSLSFQTDISNLNGRKKLLLYKSICDGVSELITGD